MSKVLTGYAEVRQGSVWKLGRPMEVYPEDLVEADENRPEPVAEFAKAGVSPQDIAFYSILTPYRGRTFHDLESVTDNRGLPCNLADELEEWIEYQELDWAEGGTAKAHTWILLRELIDFDWSDFAREYQGPPVHRMLITSLSELGDPDHVRLVCWVTL